MNGKEITLFILVFILMSIRKISFICCLKIKVYRKVFIIMKKKNYLYVKKSMFKLNKKYEF